MPLIVRLGHIHSDNWQTIMPCNTVGLITLGVPNCSV